MKSFKQFAEAVAKKLVLFHKFSPERAIMAVKEYEVSLRKDYSEAAARKTSLAFDNAAIDSADTLVESVADYIGYGVVNAFQEFREILEERKVSSEEVTKFARLYEGLIAKLGAKHVKADDIVRAVEHAEGRKF
jgi:hypothetical protein